LAAGRTPFLNTSPSAAVHLAVTARQREVDLAGTELELSGEPITPARVATIALSGAHAVPTYTASDGPGLAAGCLAPEAVDAAHLPHDLAAVTQPGPEHATDTLPAGALLFSSLSLSSRSLLLNASIGDQATMSRRDCGCPLGALGLPVHLHTIRSFEKLTA